jgi:HTH-type transcriptional regulator, global nitrogen regulator NrpRI
MQKRLFTILSDLDTRPSSIGSVEIIKGLRSRDIDLSGHTVRNYLGLLEAKGYAVGEGEKGKGITDTGRQELTSGFMSERVGLYLDRINDLTFLSSFNMDRLEGSVILNVAYVSENEADRALAVLKPVLSSPYSVNDRMVMAKGGQRLGDLTVPSGLVGIGTVCSMTINSILLEAGILATPTLAGIVEIDDGKPVGFTSFIAYSRSSIAPLEIFTKSRMTNIVGAVDRGTGSVLGSLREIPETHLADARKLVDKMEMAGFLGSVIFGRPGEPVLGAPVAHDKAGMVVLGAFNPIAALIEVQIAAETRAVATLDEYGNLKTVEEYERVFSGEVIGLQALTRRFVENRQSGLDNYWSVFSDSQQRTLWLRMSVIK